MIASNGDFAQAEATRQKYNETGERSVAGPRE